MEIYVGSRNVTPQFNDFFTRDGVTLDGNFEGNKELQAYGQALTTVRNALKNAVPADGVDGQSRAEVRAAIDERFAAYSALITSDNCEGTFEARPVLQGMYEELTAFIESDAFTSLPEAKQIQIVALQAELFSRLEQAGTHRGVMPSADSGGAVTSAELSTYNPKTEDFAAHPAVLGNVTPAASMISFEDQCAISGGDATADDNLNIYGSEGAQGQPFTGSVVNSDFRYGHHEQPAQTPAPAASNKAAPPANNKNDEFGINDPLAGINSGGDLF
jgi:hypothetical protein